MNSPDPLSPLLKSWQAEPRPAPEFSEQVWAAIDARPMAEPSPFFSRWALPLAAGLAVLFGVSFGWRDVRHAHTERMAVAYVRTIDPVQMTSHHHSP